MSDFILKATVRNDLGKGASRRLRRANQQVPAVVYGGEKGAQSISVEKTAFYKAIEDESFFSSVIKLVIEGTEEQVVVRDLQRHPFKPLLTHADFMRVDATHEITINVPLHVVGEEKCVGIKDQGGELHTLANEVAISCLPKDLPDFLEIDISNVELGTTLHLSDLTLPAGVTSVDLSHGEEHDNAILSITKVKVRGGDEEEGDSEGEEDTSAE
ncbi:MULTISPECIES: 50S ribosomal protein L25/general stress protein Ctc [Vreelandella]|uniref:Large ribosomal subunit protein bL25 n=2 Tax=Vreelandella TaxID=3137766 RepID=A0A7C9NQT8_9GAMM|nr:MULTISPECIES: 50S ribosomal protein L25/general stress protein Ctc [Halomonas]NDL71568.1 50S ribosomal protein L25/general stress protein Ctc [Halomonas alkaliphila]NYS44713.1 50S ribosomal protein L25/general stress protein Ctc [Halomonas zhaodongensis]